MGAGQPDDAAIPAVLGYHAPVQLSRDIVARLNCFAHGLHLLLLTGSGPRRLHAPDARPECRPRVRLPTEHEHA
ncbi:hypothetical protein [Burkholderia contaminans]|uniref:hypothetical protein n=1 Tax=Burkholderia contaminans TaxID=488447 RepID=UPI0008F48A64|nr:hypothetical protein [Burkholderia contaminans]